MGIFFTNAWMLLGLTALSVPVLIHLLLRRKKKRARFSTLQFFVRHDEQSSQRRKLRNWLLLALRLLICALLVLAFARPFFKDSAPPTDGHPRRVLLVLDRSLSMQATTPTGSKWARAKEAALQILSELRPNDRAALIGCGSPAAVLSEWAPAAAVTQLLKTVQPTHGAANLLEGLQQAKRLVSLPETESTTAIYVISDLQRSGAQNLSNCPLPPDVDVKTVAVGDLVTPNLAVVDLQVERKDGVNPHAVITSFSDEDSSSVRVEVSVDGQPSSSGSLTLGAGATTNLDLAIPSLKPGWHDVSVHIQAHDALAGDDSRFQTVFVPQPARVWVVEGHPSQHAFEEESFFLTTALNPSRDLTNGVQSRFIFEKLPVEELASRLAATRTRAPCDLIVLPGLRVVPPGLGRALASFVQAGGGLLLFLGDGISANRYHAEFREFLGAQLGSFESRPDLESGWRIASYDTNAPVFAPFQLPNSGNPALARFSTRLQITAGDPRSILARFSDGVPFLVATSFGSGRLVLANTSADTSWNDWPKHKSFVPWLHATGLYLAGLTSRDWLQAGASLVAGIESDIELGTKAAKQPFKITSAGMTELKLLTDDQGTLRDANLRQPGVYSVRSESGAEVRRVTVNVPPAESDLAALSSSDAQQQLARLPESRPTTLTAGLLGTGSNQREFWRVLLLAVLGLLFLEMLVANRTLA